MFDFRYHALSLAAVLLALAVGVLLGVAIGDSNLVSSAKNGVVAGLRVSVSDAKRTNADLRDQLDDETGVENDLYALAVNGALQGKSVGLVFLGPVSDSIDSLVRQSVAAAGGDLAVVASVREPLDLAGLAAEAEGTAYAELDLAGSVQPALVERFGRRIGIQLAHGGSLIARVSNRLLGSLNGTPGNLGAIVLVRDDTTALTKEQQETLADFQTGLVGGVQAVDVPLVGAELSTTSPSQIDWYKAEGMSSVDDMDLLTGRTALALALAGDRGTFGVKHTADSLLPQAVSSLRFGG